MTYDVKIKNILWKPINNFEELYKISNDGNVIDVKTKKLLKKYKRKNTEAFYVKLFKDKKCYRKSLGMLVAEHFVLNPNNYTQIYYIDGNNHNCNSNNIQWNCTTRNTKIIVDGIVFNNLKEYKKFCKINKDAQYLLDLEDVCEFNMYNKKKNINAQFKF